ncbi:MAG TPA: alpha/beta hydrolase [bacterium]|nr:alpha/beta hydrolase [bacterium]
MHRISPRILLTAVLFVLWTIRPLIARDLPVPQTTLAGAWEGILTAGQTSLRAVFHFTEREGGGYQATFDSPDQGAFGIPTDTVIVQGNTIQVLLKAIAGRYIGTREAGADSIAGAWNQGGQSFPLVLRPRIQPPEPPKRPQEPKPPFPYREEEVSFANPKAGILLAGTFTVPSGKGPFPAVVLISGSGPQDRDETVFGHRPFLVLSDDLTRRGFAVLRYDDRGVGQSSGIFDKATSRDFADDAAAAVDFLKTRKEVRKKKIGLIGHSEGGLIATMLAAESKDIALVVLMAGPGVPGDELLHRQSALIALAAGATGEEVRKEETRRRALFEVLKSVQDSAAVEERMRAILAAEMDSALIQDSQAAEATINRPVRMMNTLWFKYFLTYDPRPDLKKVRCPVLALVGEKDLQVCPRQNLPEIEAALRAGRNRDFTVRELPGLNHLFQTSETGVPADYGKIEETISPAALRLIGDWMEQKSRR